MSYTAPGVFYATTMEGTYSAINGVQSVNISRGKQRFQDPFNSATCTVELIPDATYTTPFAIGQYLDIRNSNSGSSPSWFNGRIIDIQRSYAIPYNSSTGYAPADRIVLTVVGGTGSLATTLTTPIGGYDCNTGMRSVVAAQVWNYAPNVDTGVMYETPPVDIVNPENNTNVSFLDFINGIMNTCQYSVDEWDTSRTPVSSGGGSITDYRVGIYTRPNSDSTNSFTFTDNYTGAANSYKYSGIEFVASAQSTFTQVTVRSSRYAEQTVISGNPPYNGLVYQTYASGTAAALSLANYVLSVNSDASLTPFSIESNTAVDANVRELTRLATSQIGTAVTIVFRGTTTTANLVGVAASFYADRMNCKFWFSPSLGTPFTLDSSAFGVLDTNRLGYP